MSNRPTIQGDTTEFHCLARQSNTPKKLDDYLYSDEPQLSIQIVSFEDATLVSVTWPHTFLDAMGLRALFDAWILVLRGQEDQLPPFYGFDVDPVANLGDSSPVEPYVLADRQLKGLSFFVFVVRYVFDLLWWRKDEQRIVCLPSSYLQEMKQTAMHELVIHSKSERNPFISDGDIICAWWTRLAIQHMSRTSSRTVLIMNAFDLRTALSKDIIPLGAACMSNLSGVIYTSLPAYQIFQKPLSFVASQIRRSIQEQGTRSQVEAFVALHRKLTATTGRAPMFGDSSNQLVVFSNWNKGKFFSIDFSSVVVKEGIPVQKRATPLGQPSYLHANGFVNGYSSRNAFPIFGKDAAGNYWLGGQLPASFWPRIEEAVARM